MMSKDINTPDDKQIIKEDIIDNFLKKKKKKRNKKSSENYETDDIEETYVDDLDKMFKNEVLKSERLYKDIAKNITVTSLNQLKKQNEFKKNARNYFIFFFSIFLSIEYIVLLVLLFSEKDYVNNSILSTYMISIFVETLGVIASMTKFVFDSKQENTLLEIINSILVNFKKFSGNSDNNENKLQKK